MGNMGSRIDNFFGTQSGTNTYIKSGMSEYKISDHKLIFVELRQTKIIKWGKGPWKNNNKSLDHKEIEWKIKRK